METSMRKVAIVTDSIACLTREQIEQYGIRIVPVNVMFEDRIYRNGVDLAASKAYQLLERAPEHFSTSPASPDGYAKLFRELGAQVEGILCVTISSKLSTMFNIASLAKEQVREELPQTAIEILDSKSAAAGEALIVLAAARVAVQGKELAEVAQVGRIVRDRVYVACILDTVRHVYRTGRIPKVAARVGSMLGVKPILTISDGLAHFAGVTRIKQRGVERLIEIMKQKVGTEPVHVAVMHADALEEGEKLKERVSSESNCAELFLTEFSPVMGYATGRGVLGLAFYSLPP
jgi:DegV family protein with EDD domain